MQFPQLKALLAVTFFVGIGLLVAGAVKLLEAAQMAANEIVSIPPGVKAVENTGLLLLVIGLVVMACSLLAVYHVRKE